MPEESPDRFPVDVATGFVGERMNFHLREQEHLSYGAGGISAAFRGTGMLIALAKVKASATRRSMPWSPTCAASSSSRAGRCRRPPRSTSTRTPGRSSSSAPKVIQKQVGDMALGKLVTVPPPGEQVLQKAAAGTDGGKPAGAKAGGSAG